MFPDHRRSGRFPFTDRVKHLLCIRRSDHLLSSTHFILFKHWTICGKLKKPFNIQNASNSSLNSNVQPWDHIFCFGTSQVLHFLLCLHDQSFDTCRWHLVHLLFHDWRYSQTAQFMNVWWSGSGVSDYIMQVWVDIYINAMLYKGCIDQWNVWITSCGRSESREAGGGKGSRADDKWVSWHLLNELVNGFHSLTYNVIDLVDETCKILIAKVRKN